jgi:hypothetical protein
MIDLGGQTTDHSMLIFDGHSIIEKEKAESFLSAFQKI